MLSLAAHADWSIDPRKRWLTIARRGTTGWHLTAPRLVGEVATLRTRLVREAAGGAVALGADLPIGLPRAYAAIRPEADFLQFLRRLGGLPGFFTVCARLDEIGPDRPFYPARGVAGMTRLSHALALGLADASALSRDCDRATAERPAGAPLFWTLGANQSGKAAIAAWQSLILPALLHGTPANRVGLRLWPFEGAFRSLLAPGSVALAETYPAEALRHLGIRLRGSKRRQADRRASAAALMAAADRQAAVPDNAMRRAMLDGFGADAAGEDRFDSVVGVLCVLNVLAGRRPDTAPADPWIQRWEGWVLGQTALPVKPGASPTMSVKLATSPALPGVPA
ncbi:hypothetical protein [Rhodopila sp.]|uniref:hypothetical protein n=1 Tax=Rhodopila sp. TaxID=2480087 RepID=UPI003D12A6F9